MAGIGFDKGNFCEWCGAEEGTSLLVIEGTVPHVLNFDRPGFRGDERAPVEMITEISVDFSRPRMITFSVVKLAAGELFDFRPLLCQRCISLVPRFEEYYRLLRERHDR